jgi:hypothetical protein
VTPAPVFAECPQPVSNAAVSATTIANAERVSVRVAMILLEAKG